MPVANYKDPRSYIKRRPVPIPIDRSAKIETRSIECYKTTIISASDMREEKYKRRQAQLTSQGFNAAPNVPYKGIGDPFYLDDQQLILHALGQWDGNQELDSSSSSEEDEYDILTETQLQKRQPMSAASIVLRKTKRDANTLQKEVQHGRNMIRNVRLGHGLFDLIRQEQAAKQAAADEQSKKQAERMRNEWQPPKVESSSEEETDEELEEEVELAHYMHPSTKDQGTDDELQPEGAESPDLKGRVSFLREDQEGAETSLSRSYPTTPRSPSGKKKKSKPPRPYTPHHTNLMEVKENVSKDALFRQLCALHWLIEAMALHTRTGGDQSIVMSPITSSWKLTEIGGTKTFPKDPEGMTWRELVNLEISPKPIKRKSRLTSMRPAMMQKPLQGSKGHSLHPAFGGFLLANASNMRVASSVDTSVDDSIPPTGRPEGEEEEGGYQSIFKYLNEDFAKKIKEEYDNPDNQESNNSAHKDYKKEHRRSEAGGEHSPKKSPRKSVDVSKSSEHDRARSAGVQREVASSRAYRADSTFIRPRSSPQLLHFQANRPSLKYGNIVNEMNKKFHEKKEDAALQLYEQLDQLDRQRMAVCQNKFIAINSQTKGSSFHRAVEEMRERSNMMFTRPLQDALKKKQREGTKGSWYAELMSNVPNELQQAWYYKVILRKLGRYGLIDGAGQQYSKRAFFKVLERLREWEICSPDICSAIEFCREKILEMTIEDFEEWFSQQFPRVVRPQTAPAGKDKKDKEKEKEKETQKDETTDRIQSAYSVKRKSGYRGRPLTTTATRANPPAVIRPLSMR